VVHLLAIISFALAVIFNAWNIHHGAWSWTLFTVIGLLLWCISGRWDRAV